MSRHKVVNGICYRYEVTEVSLGRCEDHNEPKSEKPKKVLTIDN
jgi:hypothetical protein